MWSAVARGSGEAKERQPRVRSTPDPAHLFSLKAFSFWFVPRIRCVSLVDRCRRVLCVDRLASSTSSYPSRFIVNRPTCRTCLTAATGGSAPSNARVNARFTSCSYEQPPPGRKSSHALIQGKFKSVKCGGWVTPRSSPELPASRGRCASATGQWPVAAPAPPPSSS